MGLRIGELSRRVGVSPELLRAWERRYGLLRPARSETGYRLYTADDEARVRRMKEALATGYSAAQAARVAEAQPSEPAPSQVAAGDGLLSDLRAALDGYDAARSHAVLDRLLEARSLETVLREVLLPYLHEVGERWAAGELTVAQEHFASDLLDARLAALGRGWDRGVGMRAVLACPAEERHELGLRCFGLALREHGWRVTYLGADVPADAISSAAGACDANAVVLAAVRPEPLAEAAQELAGEAKGRVLALGGRGAAEVDGSIAAERLPEDPFAAAGELSRRVAA